MSGINNKNSKNYTNGNTSGKWRYLKVIVIAVVKSNVLMVITVIIHQLMNMNIHQTHWLLRASLHDGPSTLRTAREGLSMPSRRKPRGRPFMILL